MSKNRLFPVLIGIALVATVALTVREAAATTVRKSQTDAVVACGSSPSRYSIHTVYVKDTGMWVAYTEDGPIGVDGGLMELMSAYRACSR